MTNPRPTRGGARTGAGRPPRTARLREAQQILLHEPQSEGRLLTVRILKRGRIELANADGSVFATLLTN